MRQINKLSAQMIMRETKPGRYGDGGGLWLQISSSGTKAWIFRFMLHGRARQMGLGAVGTFSLKEARDRAREARKLLADGKDPIEIRREGRSSASSNNPAAVTFKEAAERYMIAHRGGWKNPKHAGQWKRTIEAYAEPVIGELSVADVQTAHILNVLEPIWHSKTETASRLRGRIESVLDWATARAYREGENPARWRGHLDKLLAAPSKVAKVRHHPALPYAAMPAFFQNVRNANFISARALEFTILTAARTGEAIGARWSEVDLEKAIWTVPAARMKSGREHRVPLSNYLLLFLRDLPRQGDHIFPGARAGRPLSNMAMLEVLRGMVGAEGLTVHGFRSTFRDWAAEETNFPREIAEAALAHVLSDRTEAAYRRGDAIEKRQKLMDAWGRFCTSTNTHGSQLGRVND